MAWRFVQQPNGLLARFSDIVDDFTDYGMTDDEAIRLCMVERGMTTEEAEAKVKRCEQAGMSRWPDEIATIRSVHGDVIANERIRTMSYVAVSPTGASAKEEPQPSQP